MVRLAWGIQTVASPTCLANALKTSSGLPFPVQAMWVPEGNAWRVPSPIVAMRNRATQHKVVCGCEEGRAFGRAQTANRPSAGAPGMASPEGRTSMQEVP